MEDKLKQTRRWIIFFMIALILGGLTAMPLEMELSFLTHCFSPQTGMGSWIDKVYLAVVNMNREYPFMAYGYDWLAFAHLVLAILFIGPLQDPVRNKRVIEFGVIACVFVIPFAFIAGHFRGIPVGWRSIDCAFGIVGLIPLSICLARINQVEKVVNKTSLL